jgi:hypothetical protein
MTLSLTDTQHNDTQHNDTQHNDIQHNDTQNKNNAFILNVVMLSVVAPFITLQEEELFHVILTFIAILKEMFIREITI